MRPKLRRSQLVSIWGPGALVDLPDEAVIIGGLDEWPHPSQLERIQEPRLERKLAIMTGAPNPELYAPPAATHEFGRDGLGITAYRFPEWFLVQEETGRRSTTPTPDAPSSKRARRLVHRAALDDRGRFDGHDVVPTRFVRACPRGHISDLPWYAFVHEGKDPTCRRQLWLDETGTSGDLTDLWVRCECGAARSMLDASDQGKAALGACQGTRPWLGAYSHEPCGIPGRLLIRTATNAYFPQVVSVLSLPNQGTAIERVVRDLWTLLQIVTDALSLEVVKRMPGVAERLAPFNDHNVLTAIDAVRHGGGSDERPVKLVELDAILSAKEGYEEEVPIDPNFHARALPPNVWRRSDRTAAIERVVQLHRLREVRALVGFTRFESEAPDIHGEYESDVSRAAIAREPRWFPAIENRGEGVFLHIDAGAIARWRERPAVAVRFAQLERGHALWQDKRKRAGRPFPGGTYVMLHTLSHLLLQSLALHSGYGASSINERVYVDDERRQYGILLYTGTSDAEGTLGGLVQQARHIEQHLNYALRAGALCSNDPICAQHAPDDHHEDRWLLGAACHGCTLISETSCEMRNDHLDRALLIPTLGIDPNTAFFDATP